MTGSPSRPVIRPTPAYTALSPDKLIRQARVRRKRTDDVRLPNRRDADQPTRSFTAYQADFHSCSGA